MKTKYSEVGKPELLTRNFRVHLDEWREFQNIAQNNGSTGSKILRTLIKDYIKTNKT